MHALARWMTRCAFAGLGVSCGTAHAQGWTHPVAGTTEPIPPRDTSNFGAARGQGDRPEECEKGHCGIDLYGARGLPIVAFASGWIALLSQEANGPSGRRVVVAHPGGAMTHYLHLDMIRPDLLVGRWVESGEWIGALGMSGIHHSPAHLHFGLSVNSGGERVFIDPRPFLLIARTIDGPPAVSCSVAPAISRPLPPALAQRSKLDLEKARKRAGRRRESARLRKAE